MPTVHLDCPVYSAVCAPQCHNYIGHRDIMIQLKLFYSKSSNSSSNCDVCICLLIFAFNALALALTLGAGIRPWLICHCCDSSTLDFFATRPERWGSQSLACSRLLASLSLLLLDEMARGTAWLVPGPAAAPTSIFGKVYNGWLKCSCVLATHSASNIFAFSRSSASFSAASSAAASHSSHQRW